MGTVWLADDELMSADGAPEQVALKFILGDGEADSELISLLRKEVRAALRLSHANIVRVHSWHENPGEPVFYSMEFVPRMDLKRLLATQPTGRFTCAELDPLLFQLVEALHYAHEQAGFVHRDLKPANLLITPDGRLKLADFGLTRPSLAGDSEHTLAGGTWAYASPEHRQGRAPSVADDMYSLGAVLYHLLTGQLPFAPEELARGETPPPVHPWRWLGNSLQRRREITPEAAATLLRCLSDDPAQRPPSARAFWHWWKTGPPGLESHATSSWVTWIVTTAFVGVLLPLLFAATWKAGLDRALEPRFPNFVGRVRKLEQNLPWRGKRDSVRIQPTNTPPNEPEGATSAQGEVKDSSSRVASLTLHHGATDRGSVRLDLFRLTGAGDAEALLISNRTLPPSSGWVLTNLTTGRYRLEAGTGTRQSATDWVQQELVLAPGPNNVALDFRPGGLLVFLSEPVPFELLNAWDQVVGAVGTNNYSFYHYPPNSAAPWRVDSLIGRKLLGGRYRVRLTEWATNSLHLAAHEEALFVSAGRVSTSSIVLPHWATPRLDSDWRNSILQQLLPAVADGVHFLAARTETTVEQFAVFAEATHLPAMPMESVTAHGFTNVGRTWRNAFDEQRTTHPVVGVSWFEAVKFCEWLTDIPITTSRTASPAVKCFSRCVCKGGQRIHIRLRSQRFTSCVSTK